VTNYAIGIDLGTTYSAIAAVNESGNPEIKPNSDGERVTASAVFFDQSSKILVGQLAVDASLGEPGRVVRNVKRNMGDPDWSVRIDGNTYSAVDISAIILRKIKKDAESLLGPIKHAVVTVPAYFDEYRRKATMDAANKAGIEVLRIINEPTAAALAYARAAKCQGKVLIYDLGGGTFDVSIVEIASQQNVKVLASDGDHELGGVNFDVQIADYLCDIFKEAKGIDLRDEEDISYYLRLVAEAESAKRKLSKVNQVYPIPIQCKQEWLNARLDGSKFNELTSNLITRTEMLVENALSLAEINEGQIDAVLLVGGSTRIPAVKEMLENKFGKKPLMQISPDEAVALGASLQAAMLMEEKGLIQLDNNVALSFRKTSLQDVTSHSFGTINIDTSSGIQQLRNTIIIPKNTQIPCSKTKSFATMHDGQTAIECLITQGEDENPEFVNVIAQGELTLPPNRPAGLEVRATYSYDANGRMSCRFHDVESGRSKLINLDTSTGEGDESSDQLDYVAFEELEIE